MAKEFNLQEMATAVATNLEGIIEAVKELYAAGASYRCIDKLLWLIKDQPNGLNLGWCSISHQCLGRQAYDGSYYAYDVYDWYLCPIIDGSIELDQAYVVFADAESDYDADEEEAIINMHNEYTFNSDLQMEINELA